jgi:Skp family chaperone for outer membrane proteins
MTWQQITAAYMPALVIMVTVYIAAVSNNKRIDDVNRRIDELRADFKEEIRNLRAEMTDLRAEMKEGFRKLEERFAHPITRP